MISIETQVNQILDTAFSVFEGEMKNLESNFRGPMASAIIKDVANEDIIQNEQMFASEGATSGASWVKLSDSYGSWKAVAYPGRKKLHGPDTRHRSGGRLRDSLTKSDHPNRVVVIEGGVLHLGTDVEYGAYHEEGTTGMPARRIRRKTKEQAELLMRKMLSAMVNRLNTLTGGLVFQVVDESQLLDSWVP